MKLNPNSNYNNIQNSKNKVSFQSARLDVSEKSIFGALNNTQSLPVYMNKWNLEPLSPEALMKKAKQIYEQLQDICKKYENDNTVELEILHQPLKDSPSRMSTRALLERDQLLSVTDANQKLNWKAYEGTDTVDDYFEPKLQFYIDSNNEVVELEKQFTGGGKINLFETDKFGEKIDNMIMGNASVK